MSHKTTTSRRKTTPPARKVALKKHPRKAAPAMPLRQLVTLLQQQLAEAEARIEALECAGQRRGPHLLPIIWPTDRNFPPLSPQPGWPTPDPAVSPAIDPERIDPPFEITYAAETPAHLRGQGGAS